jgi:hypothetical protein
LKHFSFGANDIIKELKKRYSGLNNKNEKILRQEIDSSSYLKDFIALYEKYEMNFLRLTLVGMLIGAINLAKYLPQMVNFKTFLK